MVGTHGLLASRNSRRRATVTVDTVVTGRFDAGGHRGTAPAGTLTGTASTQLIRLVRDTALRAGVAPERIAAIRGVSDDALRGELDRVPMRSLMRLWELLAATGPGAGLAVVEDAPLGRLSTWDYLVTTGATLADSLTAAQPYHQLVTAATEGFDLHTAGELTVGYRTGAGDPAVAAVVNEYVLGYYLRRAREGLGRNVAPARITFSHPARASTGRSPKPSAPRGSISTPPPTPSPSPKPTPPPRWPAPTPRSPPCYAATPSWSSPPRDRSPDRWTNSAPPSRPPSTPADPRSQRSPPGWR